jgi:hypothetical protein
MAIDVPVDRLDPEEYAVAATFGWMFEYRGRVGLTGAGAWHVGVERTHQHRVGTRHEYRSC